MLSAPRPLADRSPLHVHGCGDPAPSNLLRAVPARSLFPAAPEPSQITSSPTHRETLRVRAAPASPPSRFLPAAPTRRGVVRARPFLPEKSPLGPGRVSA